MFFGLLFSHKMCQLFVNVSLRTQFVYTFYQKFFDFITFQFFLGFPECEIFTGILAFLLFSLSFS